LKLSFGNLCVDGRLLFKLKMGRDVVGRSHVLQNKDQWRAAVETVMMV
jgi:hypothetical protein